MFFIITCVMSCVFVVSLMFLFCCFCVSLFYWCSVGPAEPGRGQRRQPAAPQGEHKPNWDFSSARRRTKTNGKCTNRAFFTILINRNLSFNSPPDFASEASLFICSVFIVLCSNLVKVWLVKNCAGSVSLGGMNTFLLTPETVDF